MPKSLLSFHKFDTVSPQCPSRVETNKKINEKLFSRKSDHQTWQQCKVNIEGVFVTFIIGNYRAKEKEKEGKKIH